jgi:transcriptional regulator with XRE-family HTH domain
MAIQFADSESIVNGAELARILNQVRYTRRMSRDPMNSAYLRDLLKKHIAAGGTAKALAERAGIAASRISQIISGDGAGMKAIEQLAKPLTGKDVPDFLRDAADWWKREGSLPRKAAILRVRAAIEATDDEIEKALAVLGEATMSEDHLVVAIRTAIETRRQLLAEDEADGHAPIRVPPRGRSAAAPASALASASSSPASSRRRRK